MCLPAEASATAQVSTCGATIVAGRDDCRRHVAMVSHSEPDRGRRGRSRRHGHRDDSAGWRWHRRLAARRSTGWLERPWGWRWCGIAGVGSGPVRGSVGHSVPWPAWPRSERASRRPIRVAARRTAQYLRPIGPSPASVKVSGSYRVYRFCRWDELTENGESGDSAGRTGPVPARTQPRKSHTTTSFTGAEPPPGVSGARPLCSFSAAGPR